MNVHNADIAAVFNEIAALLEVEGANPFRVRAYHNAARTIDTLGPSLKDMVAQGEDLTALPGIGDDLAGKIAEIVKTGTCTALQDLRKELPPTLTELLALPGLGPKRVKILYEELDIRTRAQLRAAARAGRIQALPGFGAKTEARLLEATAAAPAPTRFMLSTAADYAEPLREHLARAPGVETVEIAGSYRRRRETVGDLDILVAAPAGEAVMDHLAKYDEIEQVLAKGGTRATVILHCGLQVDVRVVEPRSFGAALQYFTGSKAHNIAVRRIAQRRHLKINEYGVFKGDERVAGATEASVYRAVGLPPIAPELRENRGEIEAAQKGALPALVERRDLRGDLHMHTKATDGQDTIRAMAEAARARGLQYIAITDHSRHLAVAHGLDVKRLRRQMEEIDRLNGEKPGITILKGIEVDILEDGRLDLPDSVLGELDLVIGAVHGSFDLPRRKQTARVLRAMDHPHFTVLAHPSTRLLERREACAIDLEEVIRKAAERGCFLELNAQPRRLDLIDTYCQLAKSEHVLVSIDSDAHRSGDFDYLDYGIGQARRGWLEKTDVLNTRSLRELRSLLGRTM